MALLFSAAAAALAAHTTSTPFASRAAVAMASRVPPASMLDPAAPVLTGDDMRDSLARALDKSPKKYIALLGSTGSIGTQTLDICREYPEYFKVISISAGSNVELLAKLSLIHI